MSDAKKSYIRDQYSKYWIKARKAVYGKTEYDQKLIDLVDKTLISGSNRLILEVGIGTGWPIASSLASLNYDVYGIDISEDLINQCLNDYPGIHAEVCDAENLSYENDRFDLVYCFHSTWYFNLRKALSEMFRVTKKDGFVLFDIMNRNNQYIEKIYQNHVFENSNFFGKIFKLFKNTVKFALQKGIQDWPYVISWNPSDPVEIIDQCLLSGGKVWVYAWHDDSLKELSVSRDNMYREHQRIVICCKL